MLLLLFSHRRTSPVLASGFVEALAIVGGDVVAVTIGAGVSAAIAAGYVRTVTVGPDVTAANESGDKRAGTWPAIPQ